MRLSELDGIVGGVFGAAYGNGTMGTAANAANAELASLHALAAGRLPGYLENALHNLGSKGLERPWSDEERARRLKQFDLDRAAFRRISHPVSFRGDE
jgi:hypothetical protein